MTTEVQDRRTGLCFTQVCVGTMSDSARPCPWLLTAGAIGDRISYTHSPILISPAKGLRNPPVPADRYSDEKEETWLVGEGQARGDKNRRGGERRGNNVSSDVNSSFALVTALSEPLEASICTELVRPRGVKLHHGGDSPRSSAQSSDVAIILGPVVGKVDVVKQASGVRESCRVAVVLEVDGNSSVTCVVRL